MEERKTREEKVVMEVGGKAGDLVEMDAEEDVTWELSAREI